MTDIRANSSKINIFIVDDEIISLRFMTEELSRYGYDVRFTHSATLAAALIQADPPDLILLDVMMPYLNGYEVCRQLKTDKKTHDIPIIFISALNEVLDKVKAFAAGGVDYITKPFQIEELLARIETHLTLHRLQQELQKQNVRLQEEAIQRQQMETDLKVAYQNLKLLNNELQNELNLARRIQQSLLSSPMPDWANFQLICYNKPASQVGGDFYVYHLFERSGTRMISEKTSKSRFVVSRSSFAVAVGDVVGKGMAAALLMAISLASFQSIIGQGLDPSELLAQLDNALVSYTQATRQNCALVYAEIIPPQKNIQGMIRVANAGGVPPLVKRVNGQVEWVDIGGLPLGIGQSAQLGYQEINLRVYKGDFIILTSDGVVEANNAANEMFGFERLEQVIKDAPPDNAAVLLDYLKAEIATFVGETEPHDDLTLVVVQV